MDEEIIIEVSYKGQKYSFEARLVTTGYIHKFIVLINGIEVTYEPDEERNYRALLSSPDRAVVTDLHAVLIRLTGEKIQSI